MLFREEPLISVGILTEKKIVFELHGNYMVAGSETYFRGIFSAEIKDNQIVCSNNSDKIENTEEILFAPEDPHSESFLIRDVIIGIDFHWQRKEKQRFNHSLKIIRDGNKVVAINILPLENYIVSVISSEMSAKCSLQSLKSLSVVSRSWVLAQLEKRETEEVVEKNLSINQPEDELVKWYDREQHKNYDVCADDHCQRFQGITKVSTENAREAVTQTRGIVLLSEGKICDTRYSKSCGGITEDFENVWETVRVPYLTSKIDYKYEPENFNIDFSNEANARKWITGNPQSFCNTSDKVILSQILIDYDQETTNFFRWRVEYTQKELAAIIKDKSGIDFGDILDLIPVERGSSARLIKLRIVGTKKSLTVGKELEIRRILSKNHLYSSAFMVDKIIGKNDMPKKFILHGAGWGHGVGLCQIGGAVMAEKGYQFDEILLHYFSNVTIKKIYH
ncbi:MAG: SpoIID/LytB domain-containing protein [Bacteroidetes bacterium]|nr:SpoIID/LytB domain-containing protein [Bacteroidota bacterium]